MNLEDGDEVELQFDKEETLILTKFLILHLLYYLSTKNIYFNNIKNIINVFLEKYKIIGVKLLYNNLILLLKNDNNEIINLKFIENYTYLYYFINEHIDNYINKFTIINNNIKKYENIIHSNLNYDMMTKKNIIKKLKINVNNNNNKNIKTDLLELIDNIKNIKIFKLDLLNNNIIYNLNNNKHSYIYTKFISNYILEIKEFFNIIKFNEHFNNLNSIHNINFSNIIFHMIKNINYINGIMANSNLNQYNSFSTDILDLDQNYINQQILKFTLNNNEYVNSFDINIKVMNILLNYKNNVKEKFEKINNDFKEITGKYFDIKCNDFKYLENLINNDLKKYNLNIDEIKTLIKKN